MAALTLRDIVAKLGGEAVGEVRSALTGVATLDSTGPGDIAFLANPKYRGRLATTCASGRRGVLHSGWASGADGFGVARDGGGWVKIRQVGGVRIGDDVEIGANTTIDRGALDDTVIEDGVKLDNLIQVGHNCVIGAHTVIAGCTGISGSVRIGGYCMIGGAVGIAGHIEICDHVTISGMTMITKSITKPGTYTSGMPFMPHAEWLRNAVHLRRLDAIAAAARKPPGDTDD